MINYTVTLVIEQGLGVQMPLWLTQIHSLPVFWPRLLTLLQKVCTWNPKLAFVSSSSTNRENCEFAPQSLQSLSRCGLDPTYPPMSIKASRTDSLCRLLQLRSLLWERSRLTPMQSLPMSWSWLLARHQKASEGPNTAVPAHATCVCPTHPWGVVSLVYSHLPWVPHGFKEKTCVLQLCVTHLFLNDE